MVAIVLLALPSVAQPLDEEEVTDEIFSMPVIIDGNELFAVRGTSAQPAVERAALIESRILELAESSEAGQVAMEVRVHKLGRLILANGHRMVITTQADADFDQIDIDVAANLQSEAIEQAILKYRSDRSDESRMESVVEALIWTAVFIVLTFSLVSFRRRLPDRIAKHIELRFAGVQEVTKDIVRGQAIAAVVRFALRLILLIVLFAALYFYVSFVLLSFAETRPIAQLAITYMTDPIVTVLLGFVGFIPNFLTLLIIALLTGYAIRALRLFFQNLDAGVFHLKDFDENWIWPTFNILRGALIIIAVVLSFPYIPGSDSAAFQGVTILAGVMISFGSNSVVGNLLAGVFVIYRRSTSIGDRIKVGDHVGDVVRIKLMETHIKSIKNELVSIPNAQLLNSEVINYSSKIDGRGLLLHTTVGIGYEEPQEKVEAMLIEAARRTTGLRKSPDPFVLWTGLADYAINYQINAYTTRGSSMPKILSDLHRNIVSVFNENGVQIMTPSYISDPDIPKIPAQGWGGQLNQPKITKP